MAEDTEVGEDDDGDNKTITASVDMAEDTEVGEDDDGDNKSFERLPSRKSSGPTEYLTSLYSGKK